MEIEIKKCVEDQTISSLDSLIHSSNDFNNISWIQQIKFENCIFKDIIIDGPTSIEWIQCEFVNVTFQNCILGGANFLECNFKYSTFSGCDLSEGSCQINYKKRVNAYKLVKSRFLRCLLDHSKFSNVDISGGSFDDSIIKGTTFKFCDFYGSQFHKNHFEFMKMFSSNLASTDFIINKFTFCHLSNNNVDDETRFGHTINEYEKDYSHTFKFYDQVYRMFKSAGINHIANKYFLLARKFERMSAKGKRKAMFIAEFLLWHYGEKPLYIAYRGIGVILVFAILYYFLNVGNSLLESLYFSIVTFTTLGYGDITPKGNSIGIIFSSIEVVTGIVFTAIFTASLIKKISRG